ncbi:nucleotidyl transferase AbiEii/AbiGii toxin family protein [Myroides odoratimimus]|uniref:nucleotidyl transferase AbiEii/AbiGii toxin family protein n=2 Tax=Myroides odoratimimus TaxID=76832 RepID=UPI00257543C5|nr:nucleotidyl transferase AbiEii/AbiGii toxin family protein [Myroides odoratimimus]MDM1521440.1 nucleotidyl transferase AbiEii/AbiGii toxin family protein [Myroides odoratimimus]
MLYKQTVINELWELLQRLMKDDKLKEFILVGGTALALKIGHRLSVDIDLFSTTDFAPNSLANYLQNNYDAEITRIANNTVLAYIKDIKVDLIAHKYPLVNSIEFIDNVRMYSNEDIGAMKLHAIYQSGERVKDFIDMYFLLEANSLKVYLDAYQKKYNGNINWVTKSLLHYQEITSFKGVNVLPNKHVEWEEVTNRLQKAVSNPLLKFENHKRTQAPIIKKDRGFSI